MPSVLEHSNHPEDVDNAWRADANCKGLYRHINFFPTGRKDESQDAALALCEDCPVRRECLDDALLYPSIMDKGIRGGMTEDERVEYRRERGIKPSPKPINHGTQGGYRTHLRRDEAPCHDCRLAGNAARLENERKNQY